MSNTAWASEHPATARKILLMFEPGREVDMARARLRGRSLASIGDAHGVTGERVRQIVEAFWADGRALYAWMLKRRAGDGPKMKSGAVPCISTTVER